MAGFRDRVQELRRVRAGDLLPHPQNWRKHPVEQAQALRGVLDEMGFAGALIVRETPEGLQILDGHLRAELSPDEEVPCLLVDLDDAEAALLLATHDPIGAMAQTDREVLTALLEGVDIPDAGLGKMLADLAKPPSKPRGEDSGPREPSGEPTTRPGDLWLLGRHRLLCGDATSDEDYQRLLEGRVADLLLTDPPYGVGVDYGETTEDTLVGITELIDRSFPLARSHSRVALLTVGHRMAWRYPQPEWMLAWVEPAGTGLGPWGFTCTQFVLAYGKDPYLAAGKGSRPDTFIGTGEGASSDDHPVAKPMTVWSWFMERGTIEDGATVLDPFVGSGTTLIAAEQLNRRCFAMEISPGYCHVAVARWERFTGQTAELLEGALAT